MRITIEGEQGFYNSYSFNSESNSFELFRAQEKERNDGYGNVRIVTPLQLDSEFAPSEFNLVLLKCSDRSENNIHRVFVEGHDIGWIFPIQALVSCSHDSATDSFFLKHAYVAMSLLIDKIDTVFCGDVDINELLITDFYKSEDTVFVMETAECDKIEGFSLDKYVVSLYEMGYSFLGNGGLLIPGRRLGKSLSLKAVTLSSDYSMLVNSFFKQLIPLAEDEVSRFLMQYQIVEILISNVSDNLLVDYLEKYRRSEIDINKLKEKTNEVLIEKNRVIELFSRFCSIDNSLLAHIDSLCDLLVPPSSNRRYGKGEKYYLLRCKIVHNSYYFSLDDFETIKEINDSIIIVLMSMLFSFKSPLN